MSIDAGVVGGVEGVRASSKDVDNNAALSDNVGKLYRFEELQNGV